MLVRSTTGGSAWTEISEGAINYGYCMALGSLYQGGEWDHDGDYNTPTLMAVSRSTDGGSHWTTTSLNDVEGYVKTIAVHPVNGNIVYAGGRRSQDYTAALFKSTDAGANWTEIGASHFNNLNDLSKILIDHQDPQRIYAGTNRGVYISTNGGADWTVPDDNEWVNCMVQDASNASNLFIGTWSGVFHSTDRGASFTEFSDGLYADANIKTLDYDWHNDVLYAGTEAGGIYRSHITTDVQAEESRIPADVTLHPNFPNPFNNATTIRYDLPAAADVNLAVYDVRGRRIRTLSDQFEPAGRKQAVWDGRDESGRDLPSGIYVVRLRAGDLTHSRKVIMQK